jgi:hypothetical protein
MHGGLATGFASPASPMRRSSSPTVAPSMSRIARASSMQGKDCDNAIQSLLDDRLWLAMATGDLLAVLGAERVVRSSVGNEMS